MYYNKQVCSAILAPKEEPRLVLMICRGNRQQYKTSHYECHKSTNIHNFGHYVHRSNFNSICIYIYTYVGIYPPAPSGATRLWRVSVQIAVCKSFVSALSCLVVGDLDLLTVDTRHPGPGWLPPLVMVLTWVLPGDHQNFAEMSNTIEDNKEWPQETKDVPRWLKKPSGHPKLNF